MSAKVAPEPILDSAVRSKCDGRSSSFTALASPSDDSTAPSSYASGDPLSHAALCEDRRRWRWLTNYPRICFIALFVVCTFASGVFASMKLTQFALGRLAVPAGLARARAVYRSSGVVLNSLSACFMEKSLSHVALARERTEKERARMQTIVDANDARLQTMEQQLHTCKSGHCAIVHGQATDAGCACRRFEPASRG